MRIIPLLILWQSGLLGGILLCADVLTLKDGRHISGLLEFGNIQELHIKVGDQSQTIDIHEVQTIHLGVSVAAPSAVPPPPKSAVLAPATPEPAPAPNTLILTDGAHVAGRWWSIDATNIHFLVNNQLQHYPRHDVLGVTFGNATLPPPPEPSTPSSAAPAQPPASQPASAPTLARPSSESAPPSAPSHGLSQPEEIGMVYFSNGKVLTPLERSQAVERRRGSTQYWEMAAPKSSVRLNETPSLVFILRLPEGVDPASYSLFPLVTVNAGRRTRSQPGRRAGLATWPVDIKKNDESSLITYALTVRDLPVGEYSFSSSSSNDAYCFGVDPSTPGR